VKEKLEMLSC
jgi:hypothetical protein